jgi:two-component system OmpR family sensor kinase
MVHPAMADQVALAVEHGLDLGLGQDAPLWRMGEAEGLRLLGASLLEHALRYTPAWGTVEVAIVRTATASWLSVPDTGPGLPPAERQRVFDRF